MSNPFNDALDWALQGKYVRAYAEHETFEGWVERVHHSRGSLVMHDCIVVDDAPLSSFKARYEGDDRGEGVGSVFIRTAQTIIVLYPRKKIEWKVVDNLEPFPGHDMDFEPKDYIMRRCYRNQFAGGYPVVRANGTIINGHKRIEACKRVGLDRHPVEVVEVTDEQAEELFRIAHREQESDTGHIPHDMQEDSDT